MNTLKNEYPDEVGHRPGTPTVTFDAKKYPAEYRCYKIWTAKGETAPSLFAVQVVHITTSLSLGLFFQNRKAPDEPVAYARTEDGIQINGENPSDVTQVTSGDFGHIFMNLYYDRFVHHPKILMVPIRCKKNNSGESNVGGKFGNVTLRFF